MEAPDAGYPFEFVFALILEGTLLRQYKKNVVDRFHMIAGRDLTLSLAPTPWEWKCGEGYTLPITHDRKAQIAAVLGGTVILQSGPLHSGE